MNPRGVSEVTLIDGRTVSSWSHEWRDECLARHVLGLPDRVTRQAWLRDFQKLHGKATADWLREKMLYVWDNQKERR